MLLHAKKSIISHWPQSIITRQRALVDSKLLHTDGEMSVVNIYLNNNPQTPLGRFVVDCILYKQVYNKYSKHKSNRWSLSLVYNVNLPRCRKHRPVRRRLHCWSQLTACRNEIFTAWRYASAVFAVVVCLCVCVSVTPRYSIKTAKIGISYQVSQHVRHWSRPQFQCCW